MPSDRWNENDDALIRLPLGTVVRMLSGGPRMTVAGYYCGLVCCLWFECGDLRRDNFPPATIEETGAATEEEIDP